MELTRLNPSLDRVQDFAGDVFHQNTVTLIIKTRASQLRLLIAPPVTTFTRQKF